MPMRLSVARTSGKIVRRSSYSGLILLVALLSVGRAEDTKEVRVVTWNAGEIFHRKIEKIANERGDFVTERGQDFRNLRKDVRPDVILLQEVTSARQIEKIKELLGLPYAAISNFSPDNFSFSSLEVAIISRFPLSNVTEYDETPDGRSPNLEERPLQAPKLEGISEVENIRGFLTAEIEEFGAIGAVVHLKSARGDSGREDAENAEKREYVIAALAEVLSRWMEANPEGTTLVGGDFNVAERDASKNGHNLLQDHFAPSNLDRYDDTHAILTRGLVNGFKMRSLSRDLGESYTARDFGDIGPIDCLYVAGRHASRFGAAKLASKTYGSDHLPVFATATLTPERTLSPPLFADHFPKSYTQLMGTLWIQTSAEYESLARQAYRLAALRLDALRQDPLWSADLVQRAGGDYGHLPPAIVLDVDETVLDNSPFQARMILENVSNYDPKRWKKWVEERHANEVAGALEFVNLAKGQGIEIFYITNRSKDLENATVANLRSRGFPASKDTVLLRGERPDWDGMKVQRRAVVSHSHRILMLVGDDYNDFTPMKGKPFAERKAIAYDHKSELGRGWILLPNPVYGSWDDKVSDDARLDLDPAYQEEPSDIANLMTTRSSNGKMAELFNVAEEGKPSALGIVARTSEMESRIAELEEQLDIVSKHLRSERPPGPTSPPKRKSISPPASQEEVYETTKTAREIANEFGSTRFGLERLTKKRIESLTDRRRPMRGHFLFGPPQIDRPEQFEFTPEGHTQPVEGVTILVREAFTLGHFDRLKLPAWVCMRWSLSDLVDSERVSWDRPRFRPDSDLPSYAQNGTSLNFQVTRMERGHMARDADLEAFGFDAVTEGVLMSNIVPQRQGRNHAVWGRLENQHRFIVDHDEYDIPTVWVTSGPIFFDLDLVEFAPGGIGIPDATYKVIAWFDEDEELHARGYVIDQDSTNFNLRSYLRSIDRVEELTGLDFFPQLNPQQEANLEAATNQQLWE